MEVTSSLGEIQGVSTLFLIQQEVPDADVPEGAPHHDLVVSPAGAEGIELIRAPHPFPAGIVPAGSAFGMAAGRGDVVRRHRVTQPGQNPGSLDIRQGRNVQAPSRGRRAGPGCRWSPHPNRRGCSPPGPGGPASGRRRRRRFRTAPRTSPGFREVVMVVLDLLLATARCRPGRPGCRPGSCRQGLVVDVQVDATGQGEGHHQDRGGQVVRPDTGMDPGFEVPVPAQDGGHHQAVVRDGVLDGVRKRARVSDAGRAAVAHHLELELFQVGKETGSRRGSPSPPGTPGPDSS